jgi:hypothetical protein
MTSLSRRKFISTTVFLLTFLLIVNKVSSLPLEEVVSRRQSIRSYTSENISRQELLEVLWAAYGYTNQRRNLPKLGTAYSLEIFTVNETGSYQYDPINNLLVAHNLTLNKETIRPYVPNWPSDASEVLVVSWNQTKMSNQNLAAAEAGCLAQNVYLAAVSLELGTCFVGSIDSGGLRDALGLPSTLTPLSVMPLGYPTSSYPAATPKYDIMTGNLPVVQYSNSSFENAMRDMVFTQEWSEEALSLQELS